MTRAGLDETPMPRPGRRARAPRLLHGGATLPCEDERTPTCAPVPTEPSERHEERNLFAFFKLVGSTLQAALGRRRHALPLVAPGSFTMLLPACKGSRQAAAQKDAMVGAMHLRRRNFNHAEATCHVRRAPALRRARASPHAFSRSAQLWRAASLIQPQRSRSQALLCPSLATWLAQPPPPRAPPPQPRRAQRQARRARVRLAGRASLPAAGAAPNWAVSTGAAAVPHRTCATALSQNHKRTAAPRLLAPVPSPP